MTTISEYKYLLLLIGIACNGTASIMIKLAVMEKPISLDFQSSIAILTNLKMALGLLLYFAALIFYILALQVFPVSVAHPTLTSGAIILVSAFSGTVLGETIGFNQGIGYFLIIIGLTLIFQYKS